MARLCRPTDAQPRNRDHALGQIEKVAHRTCLVAHGADRATPQTHCLGRAQEGGEHDRAVRDRIEEEIEVIVRKRFASHRRYLRQPPSIGEKHQKSRRLRDPGHVRNERCDRALPGPVAHHQDIGLLQVALGGSRQRASAEKVEQLRRDGARQEPAMNAMARNAHKLVESRERRIDAQ